MASSSATNVAAASNQNTATQGAASSGSGDDGGGGGSASATSAGGGEGGASGSDSGEGRKSALGGNSGGSADDAGRAGEQGQGSASEKGGADGEFKVTLPEGVEVDKVMLEGFTAAAKESGVNSDQASKMAAWYAAETQKAIANLAEQRVKDWEKQDDAWVNELKSDPKLGGENFKKTSTLAQRAIKEYGGEDLRKELVDRGLGNMPSLVRAFAAMGAAMGEDNTGGGGSGDGSPPTTAQKNAAFFNNSQ